MIARSPLSIADEIARVLAKRFALEHHRERLRSASITRPEQPSSSLGGAALVPTNLADRHPAIVA